MLTLARIPCFVTFANGGYDPPPWRSAPDCRRASRKKNSRCVSTRSRDYTHFLVLGHQLTSLGQVKYQIFAKISFLALHAHSSVSMCRSDLKPSPFIFTYCIPLQYLAYVVLLGRTESRSLAVIAVTVKIQIGRMTMIDQRGGE